jgi:hypothetical protein
MSKDAEIDLKSQLLDEVFLALAESSQLREALIFKGARVLNKHLMTPRQSVDLDSNLTSSYIQRQVNLEHVQKELEKDINQALRRHFGRQDPVGFDSAPPKITKRPTRDDRFGWDMFVVELEIKDLSAQTLRPIKVELDISVPEKLLETSTTTIKLGEQDVNVQSLQRIAGEKLRAFLSSLPTYRSKIKKEDVEVRAKDLYDLSRIQAVHGLDQTAFWKLVGDEFRLTCESRFIDCQGLKTFQENWEVTRNVYEKSATIPKDIPFDIVEKNLITIIAFHYCPAEEFENCLNSALHNDLRHF